MKRDKKYNYMRKQNERLKCRGSGRWLGKGQRNFEENDNWKDKAIVIGRKGELEREIRKYQEQKERDRDEF